MKAVWTSRLGEIAKNQLPFALAQAINDTVKAAAEEAREEAGQRLNIKRKSMLTAFIRAPADKRATKAKLSARVAVMAPNMASADRGNILAQHEEAGTKTPLSGRYVAVPGRAISKGVGKRKVTRGMELRNLKPFTGSMKDGTSKGLKNTFFIRSKTGMPLLMQSQGKRARVVWMFVKKSGLTAKLGFHAAVRRRVERDFQKNVGMRLTQAIASAREIVRGGGTTSTRL